MIWNIYYHSVSHSSTILYSVAFFIVVDLVEPNSLIFNLLYRASAIFVGVYELTKQKLLKMFPENLSAFAHLVSEHEFFEPRALWWILSFLKSPDAKIISWCRGYLLICFSYLSKWIDQSITGFSSDVQKCVFHFASTSSHSFLV